MEASENLWKAAFAVAGLAGVVSFVFYGLYRRWLDVEAMRTLTNKQRFILFILFLVLTFSFAIAGLITYAYVQAQSPRPTATVEVIDNGVKKALDRVFPQVEYPSVEFNKPIHEQLQLFAEDRIKVVAGEYNISEVKFGMYWAKFNPTIEYVVMGQPDVPIIPEFRGSPPTNGPANAPASGQAKFMVSYTNHRDQKRDLRSGSTTKP